MNQLTLEKTKNGLPAAWEMGGGMTNTGSAQIIAHPDGSPKKPVYIRRSGELACKEHALFVVKVGDIIVKAMHHRRDFTTFVYRVEKIEEKYTLWYDEIRPVAILKQIHRFDRGEWDIEPRGKILDAVRAAEEKALDYHCREPYYVELEEKSNV